MQTGPGNHQSLVRLTQDLKGRWLHCLPPQTKKKQKQKTEEVVLVGFGASPIFQSMCQLRAH